MRKSLLLILFFILIFSIISCRSKNKEAESLMSEIGAKEEELSKVGVPSFLQEEQKNLDTSTNTNIGTNLSELKEEVTTNGFELPYLKTNIIIADSKKENDKFKEVPISEEFKTNNYINQDLSPSKKENTKNKIYSSSLKKKVVASYKPKTTYNNDVKVYFSYRNGKNYIDRSSPGKITTVVYVNENVWYVDYNVYAIPYSKIKYYKRYLKKDYLIGIGRNISVVDRRSQLTVFWSGINLSKNKMANGKYVILVHTLFKNSSKKVISSKIKILGKPNYLVVVVAH
ncbi:MAG: hypothetical protein ACP5KI_05780 [Brevinematia bacterium]